MTTAEHLQALKNALEAGRKTIGDDTGLYMHGVYDGYTSAISLVDLELSMIEEGEKA